MQQSCNESKPNSLVSIIMTVYNRQQYLDRAIESVLNSNYDNLELIIWDDGSEDESVQVANKYALQDTRIKLIVAPHQGRYVSLQRAVRVSSGSYLGLVDSDDLISEDAISTTANYLDKHSHIGMVYTNCLLIDSEDRVLGLDRRSSIPYSFHRLLIDFMTFHFRLLRRSIYFGVGGFKARYESAEDYDLCLRISEVTQIAKISQPLYYYRCHKDSFSGSQSLKQAYCSELAVREALVRRGLADKIELKVRAKPKFFLQRKNKVANKVFGIGLSHTGQHHLSELLNLMGIPTIHFPFDLKQIEHFDGASDLPVALAYRELDLLYPDSLFVLTIRERNDWLRSYQRAKIQLEQNKKMSISPQIKAAEKRCFGSIDFDASLWFEAYERHLDDVKNYFRNREKDLLVLDVFQQKNYRQRLRDFLGCDG